MRSETSSAGGRADDRLRTGRRHQHRRLRRPPPRRPRPRLGERGSTSTARSAPWAASSPSHRHLVAGLERADSWATDAHKWLNVPSTGIAFCAHPASHQAALGVRSAYLMHADAGTARDEMDFVPEHSRRARGFPIYAAPARSAAPGWRISSSAAAPGPVLCPGPGRAARLRDPERRRTEPGAARFEDDAATDSILAVQASGEAWTSGTIRNGRKAIRLSVSSWKTSEATSSARSRRSRPRAPSTRSRSQEAHRARRRTATTAAPRAKGRSPGLAANVGEA